MNKTQLYVFLLTAECSHCIYVYSESTSLVSVLFLIYLWAVLWIYSFIHESSLLYKYKRYPSLGIGYSVFFFYLFSIYPQFSYFISLCGILFSQLTRSHQLTLGFIVINSLLFSNIKDAHHSRYIHFRLYPLAPFIINDSKWMI